MKFTVNQKEFSVNLQAVNRAVPSRPTHAVLGCIRVVAEKETGTIGLVGFDLSLSIYASLSVEVSEEGAICIPAKLLTDIVSKLPSGDVTIESDDENEVTVTSSVGKFTLMGMSSSEYPEPPSSEPDTTPIALSSKALQEGVRSVLFAASTDDTKQVLTGICVTKKDGVIEFAATDGHRLAVTQVPVDTEGDDFKLVIPSRCLSEVDKLVSTFGAGDFKIGESGGQLVFELGDRRLSSRTLQGAYPEYNHLIPSKFANMVVCEKKTLVELLDLVSLFTETKSNLAKIEFTTDRAIVSSQSQEGQSNLSLDCALSGESTALGFNLKYLRDAIGVCNGETQLTFNGATNPVIISDKDKPYPFCLVMPVQIRE